ncbi:MAG: LLM class F420-dependent oxidoreductase [Gammaproteobacteria bacterium]
MKWGIVFANQKWPDPEGAAALAQMAEEAGFDSLWAQEHVVVPEEYEPRYEATKSGKLESKGTIGGGPDPLIWFAYAAAHSRHIKLGTAVVILPEHAPVPYAKSCATLAHLSKGRFLLGIGVGWCREEYEAVGVPWERRGARYDEYIEVLRRLWRDEVASFDGEFVKFKPLRCEPKPPGGKIPLIIGGTATPALRRAARIGDGYFPAIFPTERQRVELPPLLDRFRAFAREYGRDPASIEITTGGARTVDEARIYADMGVHRLTITTRARTIPELRTELFRFADEVIARTATL